MIDLKALREDPDRYRTGARRKKIDVEIDRILELDAQRRELTSRQQELRTEQKALAKETGPKIGQLSGKLKAASGDEKDAIQAEIEELKNRPAALKDQIQTLEAQAAEVEPELNTLLLRVPQPPDADVPDGESADDNIEIRTWHPDAFDPAKSFEENKGFAPKTQLELGESLGLVDYERGVRIAGARSYILTGAGMMLHQAVLRFAFDTITREHGFTPVSAPCLVREECMVGTGFFPAGRDQTYIVDEHARGGANDLYLAGTGEVGLMALRMDEIIDEAELPLQYATVSTCFRREAGAAGRDAAGLYRIHQFDKVEQVVICKADEAESRAWHKTMIGIVESLLQALELPYRLLQCCAADLGPKNADMIDVESWMPSRGPLDDNGRPTGAYGETHSASRLYDFQCRRLNLRYRGPGTDGQTVFAHSLNNTVIASPRVLIPLIEIHQTAEGGVRIPPPLRPYMGGMEEISAG